METGLKLTDKNGIGIAIGQDVEEILTDDYGYNDYYVSGLFVYSLDEDKNTVLLKQHDDDEGYIIPCEDIEVIVDIKELAEDYNLEYIETTTGTNGYPQNIKPALVGFETFEQAQEIADMYNLSIESFEKRDGWSLWTRNNRTMFDAYKLDAQRDFGDNYNEVDADVIIDGIKDNIDNLEYEDIADYLTEQATILEEIESAGENEVVVTYMGKYYDTLPQQSMSFYHDTRYYIIGLI